MTTFKELTSFRRAQFRASRPRIAINLFFSGGHRLLGQQLVVTLLHSLTKSIFHDAILQRVEADDHQPSAWFEHPRGRIEQRPQVVQLVVYEDSDCLESSGRRMNPSFCLIHWPGRG